MTGKIMFSHIFFINHSKPWVGHQNAWGVEGLLTDGQNCLAHVQLIFINSNM